MSERIGIVSSSTWPTPADVAAYVDRLPAGTVVVVPGASAAGIGPAEDAARRLGLAVARHVPETARHGPAAGYHRTRAVVEDCARLVAFAARDPKTRRVTEGTDQAIRLARRAERPVEVIETPVPARVCAAVARLRRRYAAIRAAPTPAHRTARVRSASALLAEVVALRAEFDRRLGDGWEEIDGAANPAEREAKTDAWCGVLLPTYRLLSDVVIEATEVLACRS